MKENQENKAKFIIEGEPKGKARPRVVNNHAFTPKATVEYENWVRLCYRNSCNSYFKGAVKAKIDVGYPIPKSMSKSARNEAMQDLIKPQKKPDLDNVAKAILDSLNKIAYDDDKQIVELIISKHYREPCYTEVILESI